MSEHRDKIKHCGGCRANYYNCSGHSTTGRCWSLPDAQLVYRWAINMQTPMDSRSHFRKVRVLNCFHGEGPYRDIYLKQLPHHLGAEWADKREQRQLEPQP